MKQCRENNGIAQVFQVAPGPLSEMEAFTTAFIERYLAEIG
ncbi:MAG: hypothetical protein OXU96_07185 [Gammaproteobacteria bacterium]|nr:hypothetical protein [Gammaproteobacteria bacterium]